MCNTRGRHENTKASSFTAVKLFVNEKLKWTSNVDLILNDCMHLSVGPKKWGHSMQSNVIH